MDFYRSSDSMNKTFKTTFHGAMAPIKEVLTPLDFERNSMLPPITAPVSALASHQEPLRGKCTLSTLDSNTRLQLPASWEVIDPYLVLPNKYRKIVKRTLKEKRISKSQLCNVIQETVECIKTVSMDVVLPAFSICMEEEKSLLEKAQVLQKRAEEWKFNSGINLNIDSIDSHGISDVSSAEQARIIGKNIFACMMQFLHSKDESMMPRGRSMEVLGLSDNFRASDQCLSQELIIRFTKDLVNCVYSELLANNMGKALHEDYLLSELLMFEGHTQMFVRREFYLDVLHHFSQCAAKYNLKIFLKLDGPSILELTWDSAGSTTITKAEKTTLNALSKIVTGTVMDIINEITENPLRTAEIVRQGKKAGMQSSDVASSCFEQLDEAELLGRRTPKPDVMPENDMLSPIAGRKDEAEEKEEEIDLEELLGKDESPTPTERCSQHAQESRLHSASIKHECSSGTVDQGLDCHLDWQYWAVEENRTSTTRPETSMEEIAEASFILPYHLIESIVDGLVSQLEATFDVNIPGIYLCDKLVDNLVKGLEKLTKKSITRCRSRQHWSTNENTTISNIVNEAHDILAQKRYLRAAWYEDEMAVAYMTVILSAVVFDYTIVRVKAQKNDCTPCGSRAESCSPINSEKELIQACASTTDSDDSPIEMRPGTYLVEREDSDQGEIDEDLSEERRSPSPFPREETPKAKRGRSLLSRIRASLSKIFRRKK